MNDDAVFETGWTRAVASGAKPAAGDLRDHLLAIHKQNAGFTEACASGCRDASGRDSYDWLAEIAEPGKHTKVLDLACGSGVLLERLARRGPKFELIGVDMSEDELNLAARRIGPDRVTLRAGMAQELDFLEDGSVDVVLCHWALTLMDPVLPVLAEIDRVLNNGGVFAAIVDGDAANAQGYAEINDLIFSHVRAAHPQYGSVDLGDPRVRDATSLKAVANDAFEGADIAVEANRVSMRGDPITLARAASGFFYSTLVLSSDARAEMLVDLTRFFAEQGPEPVFHMPINRLVVVR